MVTEIHSESEFDSAVNSAKVTVFDFHAVWCGPCKMLTPIMNELSNEYASSGANVKFFKVDVDEVRSLSQRYSISAVPSVAIFKDGKMHEGLVIGVRPKDAYKQVIQDLLE